MSITVMNNNAAAIALRELNKNNNKLANDLKKVSMGTRITGASDGASDYAISEKMRVKIRSLSQDIENVQNGRSLLKTGLGGIDDIVEELRTLKELALNSCNDHNTDVDRGILQKEFDARKAHIDNVAIDTNYNGIVLLDGRWSRFIETSGYEGETINIVSQNIESSTTEDNVTTETLAPVTSIKTVVSPKKVTTDVTVAMVDENPGEGTVTEESAPVTTTESVTSTEGPTVKIVSQSKTTDEESVTKDGNLTTVVTGETLTSIKTSTTSEIVTDTTKTTKVTKTIMTSVKEITETTPGKIKIITNGTTSIDEDGVYEFAPDYGGVLSISAKNVQLNGPSNGNTINVRIKDTGVENLYIKNLQVTSGTLDSFIAFDSASQNTLHVLGYNSFSNPMNFEKAVINAGGGLNIVGNGSLNFVGVITRGAIIGSDYQGSCGDINIGQKVNISILNNRHPATTSGLYRGAGIGSGTAGSCGNISVGKDANINIRYVTAGFSENMEYSSGACIGCGSGVLGSNTIPKCGDIIIYSGANIDLWSDRGSAAIGTGCNFGECGDIHIYSDAKVHAVSEDGGAGIGTGVLVYNKTTKTTIGDIIIHSSPTKEVVAEATDWGHAFTHPDDIGYGWRDSSSASKAKINSIQRLAYNHTEGGILDLSEMTVPDITATKYEVTTTTVTSTEVTKNISETKTTTIETYDENEKRTTTTVYETNNEKSVNNKLGNPLIIHTGTKANQNLPIYIEDMRLESLGIKDTLINPLERAKESLDIIDAAIDYALDQATTLGAYYNELEFTESNLTSANENTVAPESVIRDADMAKEMLNYTKNNILSQAIQSMLSQAYQNASSVIGLLQ